MAALAVALRGREALPDRGCARPSSRGRGRSGRCTAAAGATTPARPPPRPGRHASGRRTSCTTRTTSGLCHRTAPNPRIPRRPGEHAPDRGAGAMIASPPRSRHVRRRLPRRRPQRVVDTALVALVESGRVRVHAPGELAAVDPDRRHPVEAAVLDAVGTLGHRSVDTIRWRLMRRRAARRPRPSLAADDLLRRRMLKGRGNVDPTRAGREALRRLAAQPPVDRPSTGAARCRWPSAAGRRCRTRACGRRSSSDRALPQVTGREVSRRLRKERMRLSDDPALAAYHTRTTLGGAARSVSWTAATAAGLRRLTGRGRSGPPRRPGAAARRGPRSPRPASPAGPCARHRGRRRTRSPPEPLDDQLAVRLRDHLVDVAGQHEGRHARSGSSDPVSSRPARAG